MTVFIQRTHQLRCRSRRVVIGLVSIELMFSGGAARATQTALPTQSPTQPTTISTPTPTRPLVSRRGLLLQSRTLGLGQLRFEPPENERPKTSLGTAVALATRSIRAKVNKVDHEVFFALFSARSPAQRNPDGTSTPVFRRRPVWVVRFPSVIGRRQSGVVQRKNSPTTTSLEVTTEIVAIVDDRTGKVVLSSEYLPEPASTPVG